MPEDARALLAARKYVEAEAALRSAIASAPGEAFAHDTLGVCLFYQGRLAESVVAYRAALAIDPKRASTWYNLGISLSDLGEVAQAVEAYRTALAVNPTDESAKYNLSLLLLGEWQEGFKLYEARGRKAAPLYQS